MVSVHTNKAALVALQALNAANREVAGIQQRISTGLRVSTPADNAAVYAIAQNMRAEIGGWQAAAQSLARGLSALEVASTAAAEINELLVEVNQRAAAYQDASLDTDSRNALRADMSKLIEQIDRQAKLASFDNLNLLANEGVLKVMGRSWIRGYSLPSSTLTPQSFLTPMQMVRPNTTVSRTMTTETSYQIPASTLTPEAFASLPRAVASEASVSSNISMVSGTYTIGPIPTQSLSESYRPPANLRYDLLLDTYAGANAIEVWEGGTRVAATGQPYVAGAGSVGAATPITGEHRLSFDYDHTKTYEVRTVSGGAWGRYSDSGYTLSSNAATSPPGVHTTSVVATSGSSVSAAPLNLETDGAAPPNGTYTHVIADAGNISGRVDLIFDASLTPDIVEVWQDGQRVAASGLAYVPGGAPVAAGAAVTGQHVISFDYDATKPHGLEIRFNENNVVPGNAWVVGGLVLQDPSEPIPTLSAPLTTQTVAASTSEDTRDLPEPLAPLTPETGAAVTGTATHTIDGGEYAGRVDFMYDAFDSPDIIEVWQSGVRIAATGQAYAPGGGGVGAGVAVTGQDSLSFDYDPADGRMLEFRINEGQATANSAWIIGGLVLQDPSANPPPTSTGITTGQTTGTRYVDYAFIDSSRGGSTKVESRNLTASGLHLDSLDWNDPESVRQAVRDAMRMATEAAQHFGVHQSAFENLLKQNTHLQDTLTAGVGNLVDANLAREAAKLQAAQVKQQLAAQALGIGNANPQWILQLFRGP